MSIRKPIIKEGHIFCPHDDQGLVPVGGNGKPRSLECSCGYVWYLGEKIEISNCAEGIPSHHNKRIPPETKEAIKRMLHDHVNRKDIAEAMDVSVEIVDYYKKQDGLTKPNPRITAEDKKEVVELAKQKLTNKVISQRTGLTFNSVFYIRSCARAMGEL